MAHLIASLAIAAVMLFPSLPSQASTVDKVAPVPMVSGNTPQAILEIAKGFGSATLEKDGVGDPKIVGRIDGTKYNLYFFNCEDDHTDCDTLQFTAGWTGFDVSLRDLNVWNLERLYGKAYLDKDNDPILEMTLVAAEMPASYLEEWFEWWQLAMKEFHTDVLLPARASSGKNSPADTPGTAADSAPEATPEPSSVPAPQGKS